MTATEAVPEASTAFDTMWSLAQALVPSRTLHLVAELGVADALDEPATPAQLAARCNVDADALARMLRLLCSHGIFRTDGTVFEHNEASRMLRTDHPMSFRAFARLNSLPCVWDSLRALDDTVRSGRAGVRSLHPDGLFGYLAEHPEQAMVFGEAMTSKAQGDTFAVLDAYDFSRFSTIADIAGGRGHLLTAVLETVPAARGVLFELPQVLETAVVNADRVHKQAGDFFADDLPVADAYLLMEIIHDWDDQDAVRILSAIRRAAPSGATVLILEHIPPDDGVDRFSATLDVLMLAVTGGRERTAGALHELLRKAGLTPTRVVRTRGPIAVVEAVAL